MDDVLLKRYAKSGVIEEESEVSVCQRSVRSFMKWNIRVWDSPVFGCGK